MKEAAAPMSTTASLTATFSEFCTRRNAVQEHNVVIQEIIAELGPNIRHEEQSLLDAVERGKDLFRAYKAAEDQFNEANERFLADDD